MRRLLKKTIPLIIAMLLFVSMDIVVLAENTAKDYMTAEIREAYHNMRLIYHAYYDDNGELKEQPKGYVAYEQKWSEEGNLISRTYIGSDGEPVNRLDGYSKVKWVEGENDSRKMEFFDNEDKVVTINDVAFVMYVKDGSDGWTEWMTPKYDIENSTFIVGIAILGEKVAGDRYTCEVEVEFKDVEVTEGQTFWFRAQGAVDDAWKIANVWNDDLISLREVPESKVYTYASTSEITDSIAQANAFNIGFRCDHWKSGSFRVRNINISKVSN